MCDTNVRFRAEWHLFRLVFGRDVPHFDDESIETAAQQGRHLRTLKGDVVNSQEERLIADWLFYNGVTYEYERDYEVDTADAEHSQYRPDFYYPDIDVYHEHWAMNAQGRVPPSFEGYLDGMRWKQQTHADHGTTLLETLSGTVSDGTAFDYLTAELAKRGIELDPDPDRRALGPAPISNRDLVKLFRTFMIHAKSNALTAADLERRRQAGGGFRAQLFLRLFHPMLAAWDSELREANQVDFEDMLNLAAQHLECGDVDSSYDLVMVDEMQDASFARARLVRALVAGPGRRLFAVGDDWQSINRFAGADISVMTKFESLFGAGEQLQLQTTFRSPQSICNIASAFVMANPHQLRKKVRSAQPEVKYPVRIVSVTRAQDYSAEIINQLTRLDASIRSGSASPGRDGPVQVCVLARYNRVLDELADVFRGRWENLEVLRSTIHAFKGKEVDYIFLPGVTEGRLPSTIEDDSLLSLAMPAGDDFPHAEERRLFYVALTRARRSVLILTERHRESPFVQELAQRPDVWSDVTNRPGRVA